VIVNGEIIFFFLAMPAVTGIVLLCLWGAGDETRRRGPRAFRVAGCALVALTIAGVVLLDMQTQTMLFRYEVTMIPDGVGVVRVSVPIPDTAVSFVNVAVSVTNGSVEVNRTGREPAYDVTLAGPGTLTATFSAYRYAGPHDLTRAESFADCSIGNPCNATVSVLVISGNATVVHLTGRASWSQTCYYPTWMIDAVANPGEREYPASWQLIVC
jgi:hypothetical protein